MSVFGWIARILGGAAILVVVLFCGLFAYYYQFVYRPQEAFVRLSGPDRRLAIYDAFAAQIDRHYYDQSFTGFDWPTMRQEGRTKAAATPNDLSLYLDVLFQMTQRFPASHVLASPPTPPTPPKEAKAAMAANVAPTPNAVCTDRNRGLQYVQIRRGRGTLTVVGEVWPGSPAARAGVTPGLVVESLQETGGRGQRHFKATFIQLDLGQMHAIEGTGSVQLSGTDLERLRRPVDFKYRCGTSSVGPFETRRLPSGALYIRFDAFQLPVLKQVEAALRTASGPGVVLDLRSNVGGYSILALNLLIPPSTPVYFERRAGSRRRISTDRSTWRYSGPVVVLIGPASASAAEVTAAALKREHRASLVGRKTNGSVLGSNTFLLPDGGMVQVPVIDIEMLDGRRLEGAGVAPDIEVYPTEIDLLAGRDPALERAERELLLGNAAPR
ncbi:S41 family peptidase [Caulobacter sp. DWR1-3-2b1]|uniref:S41 family peptidase n=1 Tax=Caulobacter sp. DWR1-3-2b1 TaxID=2804670 RepID=UPI003CF48994